MEEASDIKETEGTGAAGVGGYEACSGCSLCLLPCPVWRRTGDLTLTAQGRAKAMQWGAGVSEIKVSIDSCLLCGACEALCPEGKKISATTMARRAAVGAVRDDAPQWTPKSPTPFEYGDASAGKAVVYLPLGGADCKDAVAEALGGAAVLEGLDEYAAALEAGLPVPGGIVDSYLSPLACAHTIVVSDGLLIRPLKERFPATRVVGVGEAMLSLPEVRLAIGEGDLYIIDSRVYNTDFERLVKFYDHVVRERCVSANLDLNRVAVPTGAASLQARSGTGDEGAGVIDQARWIMKGKSFERVIYENPYDGVAFRKVTDVPVIHIGCVAGEARGE